MAQNTIEFLLEIGVEELPVADVKAAKTYLYEQFQQRLQSAKLDFDSINVYATPRRLVVHVPRLQRYIANNEQVIVGPPKTIAYSKGGKPTKTLIKFLEANNASLSDVTIVKRKSNKEYVAIKRQSSKTSVEQILSELILEILSSIPFRKRMKWSADNCKFARPVRWILVMLGNKLLTINWCNISSNNITYGHRFMHNKSGNFRGTELCVKDVTDYFRQLQNHAVIVDQNMRKQKIEEFLDKIASKHNAKIPLKQELLDENAYLTEYVYPIAGDFDNKYLELPELVIITIAAKHQRFFCLQDKTTGKLIPKFIAISNTKPKDDSLVLRGYKQVLQARLEDALFFYKEDLKYSLESLVPQLKQIIQHPKIGSMYDKTKRLVVITEKLAQELYPDKTNYAKRAAYLSKADLLTNMVRELDELQGYMGYIYALKQGELVEIARALWEQYMPKSAADSELPATKVGLILAIADRLDNLVSYFAIGETPTNNADPYGLRRAAITLIRLLDEFNLDIDLSKYIKLIYELLSASDTTQLALTKDAVIEELDKFFKARAIAYFSKIYPKTIVKVVIEDKSGLDILTISRALKLVFNLSQTYSELMQKITEVSYRLSKLLQKHNSFTDYSIDQNKLMQPEEINLYQLVTKLAQFNWYADYNQTILNLQKLTDVIEQFLQNVYVNVADETIRRNRLALLAQALNILHTIANFENLKS